MSVDSSRVSTQVMDGLHNYEVKDQIASEAASLVFRAICKRGRMRNRLVVVKKNETSQVVKDPISAASLHSTLCHPTVVTLISSFSAPSGFYQVLEFCENGSLSGFLHARDAHSLTEEELRGVARALVDALVYLKKERVLHRDIKPSNIFITRDFRLVRSRSMADAALARTLIIAYKKLSGFGFAIRLPRSDSTETAFCGSPNYVSPEILSGLPYRFTTDLWSVGSVLVTCLAGQPAFYAPTTEEVFENICCARYTLPDGVSYEAQDLIAGMLQKEPEDRTPPHRILSHPFFKPTLAVHPLSTNDLNPDCSENTGIAPSINSTSRGPPSQRYPSILSRDPERLRPMFPCKQQFASRRTPLDDITNFYQDVSQDDVALIRNPRRTRSAPTIPGLPAAASEDSRPPTPALTADSGTPSVSSLGPSTEEQDTGLRFSLQQKFVNELASPRAQLKRVLSEPCASTKQRSGTTVPKSDQLVLPAPVESVMHRTSSQATTSTAVSKSSNISVDLRKFATRRLKPRTHKLSRGQLVVLPSKALLADFRESERRKGHEGKQVIMISPDGDTVEVYDAPHLSTPCCLVEPVAVYTPRQLPAKYGKQYEDAMQIVDQLNARIPKVGRFPPSRMAIHFIPLIVTQLVHFADEAKCTLMTNGPPGDIEIHIPAEEDAEADDREAIRVRLQRSKQTLEISRHIKKTGATRRDVGEWTKKVIPLSHALELPEDEHRSLDGLERLAMARLGDFLRVCEAAEAVEGDGGPSMDKHDGDGRERLERTLRHIERTSTDKGPERARARPPSGNRSRASGVSLMVVPPRPRKFSSTVMLR
ncbi:kinase-like domain-containing protein [Ganoderma leucocontextum]|nr:kinase-like domain-containing protein [Ganoderma leucocontextum]